MRILTIDEAAAIGGGMADLEILVPRPTGPSIPDSFVPDWVVAARAMSSIRF